MPAFTALLHTHNDALRLGRTLEMLLPCSEILIVDHDSSDATLRTAREYGARIITAKANSPLRADLYLDFARNQWIFCIQPGESINESLQCSLFEWNLCSHDEVAGQGYSVFTREQTMDEHWIRSPEPEVRLVQRNWNRWRGNLPAAKPSSIVLEGDLLRFARP
jgi:glycosyltransferase involved in cell wall biosynthesis